LGDPVKGRLWAKVLVSVLIAINLAAIMLVLAYFLLVAALLGVEFFFLITSGFSPFVGNSYASTPQCVENVDKDGGCYLYCNGIVHNGGVGDGYAKITVIATSADGSDSARGVSRKIFVPYEANRNWSVAIPSHCGLEYNYSTEVQNLR
jgi:hypothetical protein